MAGPEGPHRTPPPMLPEPYSISSPELDSCRSSSTSTSPSTSPSAVACGSSGCAAASTWGGRPPPICLTAGRRHLRADLGLRKVGAPAVGALGYGVSAPVALPHTTPLHRASMFSRHVLFRAPPTSRASSVTIGLDVAPPVTPPWVDARYHLPLGAYAQIVTKLAGYQAASVPTGPRRCEGRRTSGGK